MNISTQIPSVNFHLWKPCNMKCRFCFATFQDVGQNDLPKGHMPRKECLAVVEALAQPSSRGCQVLTSISDR